MGPDLLLPHAIENPNSTATRTAVPTYFSSCAPTPPHTVSTPLPEPLGQPALLRLTSESVWPRPSVQPCAEPIDIQDNIPSVCAHTPIQSKLLHSQPAVREETQRDSASTLHASVSAQQLILQMFF